ncbi:MAG TPA: LLM class flavin-dependent oxidoreductase [Candidatus Limnocylindrales bacterium]|jgi:alkanesulfonate monooxygenase SsuD/methylene tetrahydromethanopterin reductase-like flavin-dependent oxidoreductase (luciferase family)|nr:LLM class flavin-dependent oxidoreductase [Candidatus Limnocylindrales bacterium]
MREIRIGALCWNQYTDWPSLLEAGCRAERLGYDSLWTWDHVYPIVGSDRGPIFEGWLTLTAWAMATSRVRIGLMVGANTFRNPALVAKMATTFDHISKGRAILGLGAAWFETEHRALGLPYGRSPGERLRWLGEALPIIRGMFDGTEPTVRGERYQTDAVRNLPPPVQGRLPLLVGGGGERVTLRLVARYADACNLGGRLEDIRRKEGVLRAYCEEIGRDPDEIERTTGLGAVVIRDSEREARRAFERIFAANGDAPLWTDQPVGTPEQIAERLGPLVELGYRHLVAGFPAPYDEESMARLAGEIRALLRSR